MSSRTQWEQYPTWTKVLLGLTSLPVVLTLRAFWQIYPGVTICALFWLVSLADEPLRWHFLGPRRRVFYGIAGLGAVGNAIATLSNGGFMPVLNMERPASLWVPVTTTSRVVWLCDIYAGVSLGDFFIIVGLLGLLLVWLAERFKAMNCESTAEGKHLPGIGIG